MGVKRAELIFPHLKLAYMGSSNWEINILEPFLKIWRNHSLWLILITVSDSFYNYFTTFYWLPTIQQIFDMKNLNMTWISWFLNILYFEEKVLGFMVMFSAMSRQCSLRYSWNSSDTFHPDSFSITEVNPCHVIIFSRKKGAASHCASWGGQMASLDEMGNWGVDNRPSQSVGFLTRGYIKGVVGNPRDTADGSSAECPPQRWGAWWQPSQAACSWLQLPSLPAFPPLLWACFHLIHWAPWDPPKKFLFCLG